MYRRRQWHVAVFRGNRAEDLLMGLTVIAGNSADAIQQAYEYVAEHWTTPANQLAYIPVAAPIIRERGRGRTQ
jgi:hypothetical protein